jgi:amino acid transporter
MTRSPDRPIDDDPISRSADRRSTALTRQLGLLSLTAIAVNGVIGSGIFVLPATVAALMGPASPSAYLIAAALTALVVLCFAEAGSRFEETGGPYIYAREAFGRFIGFEVGWMFFLSRLAAAAAIANAFVAYAGYFWPPAAAGAWRAVGLLVATGALVAINVAGVRHGSAAVNALTIAKLGPLLLFVGAGLWLVDTSGARLLAAPDTRALREASLLLIFAFGGFENASVPAEEAKRPRRDVPIALVTAILVTAALYILVQVVALGALPTLAGDPTPLASAARAFLGPAGGSIMTAGALVSTAGSLSALALVGPRILYALSTGGQMPAALGRIHPRFRTPHVAVVAFGGVTWLVAVAGTFAQLAAVSAIARLVFSATTCLAVPVLRRRTAGRAGFVVPGGVFVPALAAGVSLWLLTGITRAQALAGAAALAVGGILYSGHRRAS